MCRLHIEFAKHQSTVPVAFGRDDRSRTQSYLFRTLLSLIESMSWKLVKESWSGLTLLCWPYVQLTGSSTILRSEFAGDDEHFHIERGYAGTGDFLLVNVQACPSGYFQAGKSGERLETALGIVNAGKDHGLHHSVEDSAHEMPVSGFIDPIGASSLAAANYDIRTASIAPMNSVRYSIGVARSASVNATISPRAAFIPARNATALPPCGIVRTRVVSDAYRSAIARVLSVLPSSATINSNSYGWLERKARSRIAYWRCVPVH